MADDSGPLCPTTSGNNPTPPTTNHSHPGRKIGVDFDSAKVRVTFITRDDDVYEAERTDISVADSQGAVRKVAFDHNGALPDGVRGVPVKDVVGWTVVVTTQTGEVFSGEITDAGPLVFTVDTRL